MKDRAKAILRLYKLREKVIGYYKNHDELQEIEKNIEDNFKQLEKYLIIKSRSNIEYTIEKKTSSPAFLWQQELVAIYHIFVKMLGVIDARYDQCEKDINFLLRFKNNNSEELEKAELEKNKLLTLRSQILENYSIIVGEKEISIIKEILPTVPLHNEFYKLSEDMKKTHYNLSLQGEFMIAYLEGYNKSLYFSPYDLFATYEILFLRFYKKIIKFKEDEKKVKKLVKKQ